MAMVLLNISAIGHCVQYIMGSGNILNSYSKVGWCFKDRFTLKIV